MDEVAREAVLEAMQQNNRRPFDSCRQEMVLENISIPPKKSKKKKKKGGRKKNASASTEPQVEDNAPVPWETYPTMKEALKAGWEVSSALIYSCTLFCNNFLHMQNSCDAMINTIIEAWAKFQLCCFKLQGSKS